MTSLSSSQGSNNKTSRTDPFTFANDVMAAGSQALRQFHPEHLIQIQAHGGSGRFESSDFGMQDRLPRVAQRRLNIGAC